MIKKYRLMDEGMTKGQWLTEFQLLELIKICHARNKKLRNILISAYEYMEGTKFDMVLLKEDI